jgi:uncharacterized SAM-binding protein YcdF (DUF218 family)
VAFVPSRKTFFLILVALVAGVAMTRTLWLGALGAFLIHADQPAHADYALVLAGDAFGHRIMTGGDLVRQGFVRKAIVSGPQGCYGFAESDLAVNFAVKHGYPAEYFIKAPNEATSTRDEASFLISQLRLLGAHSFLVVTSDYHTRRAGSYFRRVANGMEMRVIAAPDEYFRWDSWWRNREGQKIFYLEWSKTVAKLAGF